MVNVLISFAGLPPMMEYSGNDLFTKLFAATMQNFPNDTFGMIIALAPIQQWSPIEIAPFSRGKTFCISGEAFGPESAMKITF